ncbi:MAG TPA: T9SS type A sorting domain-containing protein, partial [Chitinophagaceae bacterium]|nr:T9SS type A sorting domain-containing protein [Chitinophagaceae bacterium]
VTLGVAVSDEDAEDITSSKIAVTKVGVLPNPFNSSFRISGLQNKTALLDVINMQGITVAHFKSVSEGNNFGENLKAGTYLLRFTFDDGTTQSLKVIKQ